MSIPIGMTKKEFDKFKRELMKAQDFICLDSLTHIKALLVGRHLAERGILIKAKIIFNIGGTNGQ